MSPEQMAQLSIESSPPEVVLGHDERMEAGLEFWCDGTMGIHRTPMRTLVVSPNGPGLAHHHLDDGGFRGGLRDPGGAILHRTGAWDHASGGPILHDEETGDLVLIYHGETFTEGDPRDYYSFIGMARSVDDGRSFRDLGPVVRTEHVEHDAGRPRPVEVGSGSPVVHDGHLHVFFQDRSIHEVRSNLCVARAPLVDVFAATRRGLAPTFLKYWEGRWSSPGLDGPADDLLAHHFPPPLWFDTAYVAPLRRFMVVYSTVEDLVDGVAHWMHLAAFSEDGVSWGPPVPLYDEPVLGEILYVTIDSGGPDQRRIEGDEFDLYRVWSDRPFRWHNAHLERLRVRIHADPGVSERAPDPTGAT